MSNQDGYGTGDTKLHIDTDINGAGEVLFWGEGEDGDDISDANFYITKEDAKGIIDELKSIFGLEGVE